MSALAAFIEAHGLAAVTVACSDMNGIPRGKTLRARRFLDLAADPIRMSSLMATLDAGGIPVPPPDPCPPWWPAWSTGFPDARGIVDAATVRLDPWQPGAGFALCDFARTDGSGALDFLPRATLARVLSRLEAAGYEARAASEIEFVLLADSPARVAARGFKTLRPLWSSPQAYEVATLRRHRDTIEHLRARLEAFGIVPEAWGIEAGPGQVEMNFAREPALAAADTAFLFKLGTKLAAEELGLTATFLPKPFADGIGSGQQLNLSLWRDGRNAFFDAEAPAQIASLCRQFTAGLLATLSDFALLYAPTPNAYRRLAPHAWAGVNASWGVDNKSAAVRVVADGEARTRIEFRVPGSDANPYLVAAGCLAGGLHGIENRLDPGDPVGGDAYERFELRGMPADMDEALALFAASAPARALLGERFVDFFAHGRRHEASLAGAEIPGAGSTSSRVREAARYLLAV